MTSLGKWTLATGAVLAALLLVTAGVLLSGQAFVQSMFGTSPVDTHTETVHSQVVNAVERTQEVSLVSLAMMGIEKKTESTSYFGVVIPGSERTKFLQYSFDAKLGLDGEDVAITQTGEKQYTISISEFTFIGFDNLSFELATESDGVLSWITPEIDTASMASNIINDETKRSYIDKHRDLLSEQAKAFYGGIVGAVDPSIELTFEFGHA